MIGEVVVNRKMAGKYREMGKIGWLKEEQKTRTKRDPKTSAGPNSKSQHKKTYGMMPCKQNQESPVDKVFDLYTCFDGCLSYQC